MRAHVSSRVSAGSDRKLAGTLSRAGWVRSYGTRLTTALNLFLTEAAAAQYWVRV